MAAARAAALRAAVPATAGSERLFRYDCFAMTLRLIFM